MYHTFIVSNNYYGATGLLTVDRNASNLKGEKSFMAKHKTLLDTVTVHSIRDS